MSLSDTKRHEQTRGIHFRHDALERDGGDRVPDFSLRISGGEWSEYRKNIEEAITGSSWRDFVQITEIMHDRVHHIMYNSIVYDNESRDRGIDIGQYIGDRTVYPSAETLPEPREINITPVTRDEFRELVWHTGFEEQHLHSAMQKMQFFTSMLYELMDQWAGYAAQKEEGKCRPPDYAGRISGEEWSQFVEYINECSDDQWSYLVRTTALMHDRISHMNYKIAVHLQETNTRPGVR